MLKTELIMQCTVFAKQWSQCGSYWQKGNLSWNADQDCLKHRAYKMPDEDSVYLAETN